MVAAALLLITGCTITQNREALETRTMPPALQELALVLPGRYVTPQQASESPALLLNVNVQGAEQPDQLRLTLEQRPLDRPDQPPRRFQWLLYPGERQDVRAEFAPLASGHEIRRRCDMSVSLRRDGLSAQTDPATCSFGEDGTTGLLKEIAFDGSQLVIGDHLISTVSGDSLAPQQVLRFVKMRRFRGWAGVRDGDEWRMARDLSLDTRRGSIEPRDAAGMDLGINLELGHYELSRSDGRIVLRLTARNPENGATLAEAWADIDAQSIGLVLPDLQIGFELVD